MASAPSAQDPALSVTDGLSQDRREGYLKVLGQIVEPLAQALGCEVLVHDLRDLDESLYAIAGSLTNRSPGDPATDLLVQHVHGGTGEHLIGYRTQLANGREGRSSTMILRDPETNEPMAAMCVNMDITDLQAAHGKLGQLLGLNAEPSAADGITETFPTSVDDLLGNAVDTAITGTGVAVDLMKKPHKMQVVTELRDRGMFQIKDAVDYVAARLEVSRFTVYNYLNEIER
ncbi:transcriptional regulator [Streptomyces antnestii]|uniref:Transcriptional regulator n=1 Tax=Streptomyces antnestii TaxID=2494256 RepID=A0A3S2YNC9_9ACTN|nr:PAS domain-containing protein [Streptomyces sp. San01]RVU15118.1 transcriptional regulator [Streptomyces sp. San01]